MEGGAKGSHRIEERHQPTLAHSLSCPSLLSPPFFRCVPADFLGTPMKGDGGDEWMAAVMRKNHALGESVQDWLVRVAQRQRWSEHVLLFCGTHSRARVHLACRKRAFARPYGPHVSQQPPDAKHRRSGCCFPPPTAALRLMEVREAYLDEFEWGKTMEMASRETREANTRLMRAAAMASLQVWRQDIIP